MKSNHVDPCRVPQDKRPSRAAGWWAVAVYAALAAAVAAAGWLHLRSQQADARRKAEDQLNTIADLKVQQIADWRRERLNDGTFFAQAAFVRRDVRAFLDAPASAAKAELLSWLTLLKGGDRYARVWLFDARGELRLMLPDDGNRPGPMVRSHIADVLRDPRVQMTDLHRGDSGDIHLNLAIPVFALPNPHASESSRVQRGDPTDAQPFPPLLAVLLLELDPGRFLYPLIQSWPVPSQTAETLLVRRDGGDALFLNELRHRTNTALSFRVPLTGANVPAVWAALGQVGTREGLDYRGVPVLAAVRAVPDSPWFMVAKVD